MPATRRLVRSTLALAGLPLLALGTAAAAQDAPMSAEEVSQLPPEYRTGPIVSEDVTEGPDGVEVITRTRRIEAQAPAYPEGYEGYTGQAYARQAGAPPSPGYQPYGPAPVVFERERWIEECERRTSGRDEREKGGIIGALLGAITGGIIGNRVADGERLAGTLIGAGTGGLAGLLLGNLIGGGKKNDRYDCEAALDSYISQYGYPAGQPARIASRSIPSSPAQAPAPAPAYGYAYPGYGYGYAPSYSYAPPPQMVMVPVRYEQPQRVIVRETVREETVPAARSIPAPAPAPAPRPVPRPQPSPKMIKGD
ncbi:glycine zipper 2TM domain-containing protein [Erythrobacter sp.]|uniref:glycine zipper 2TM domain-containing protein n=1 Tax=Erythrobacter sp. TaxID=1042 RepID=UPI001425F936|nr:glycine zipper 2TM domain-containing protein [Erythrobacter sp.]QIQ87487.1 MAG: hypothetical protein G9473_12930 [Erythrobacter sp.]